VIASPARRGFSLFELMIVMAIIVLLAAIVLPSVGAFRGDTRQRAAADLIRGELAAARARAKEEGRPYRVALNDSHTRIRRAPDDSNFETAAAAPSPGGSAVAVDYPFDHVTAEVASEQDAPAPAPVGGWVTLASVQPDGTCRENSALVAIKENDAGVYLRLRGLTASLRVVPKPASAR
jgi:prepilin-type N-terminal cleavage/methylation domain-containing protein